MNSILPIVNDTTDPSFNIYYRNALKRRLAHRMRMIELSVRTELYRQDNNAKQSRLVELDDEIRHLSSKWADDAHMIEKLSKSEKVVSWR